MGTDGGGGGSRSAASFEFSNNLNKLKRPIGEIREKAGVQVQNKDIGLNVRVRQKESESRGHSRRSRTVENQRLLEPLAPALRLRSDL